MSYEDAIEAMRGRDVEPAPLASLQEKQKQSARPMPIIGARTSTVATVVAALGFAALAVRPALSLGGLWNNDVLQLQLAAVLPASLLLWVFGRVREAKLSSQLLCRAVWWSSLVVGLLVVLNYTGLADKILGATIAVACATALRSAGEEGLDIQEPDHPFAPVRFRGHLLLALVMAAADALTLMFSGLMQLRFGMAGWNLVDTLAYAGPTVLSAGVMALAVWGVFRLRTWALLLNLVANIAIAYFAMEGTLRLSPSVSVSLAATAAIQCFIPVPILAAALGDRNAGQPLFASARQRVMRLAVTVLATCAVGLVAFPFGDGWVEGPGRSFVRGGPNVRGMRSPRVRLFALTNELRGRDFDEALLIAGEFEGADLRGASMSRAVASSFSFDGADLRGANFRFADLGGRDRAAVSFRGVRAEGADFTGALVTVEGWAQIAAGGHEGVTCPDGTKATERAGCDGHLGHFSKGYRRVFTWKNTATPERAQCGRKGEATVVVAVDGGGPLIVQNERFVRLADGVLVSRFGSITVAEDGTWHISSERCGENVLVPYEAPQ